MFRSKNSDIENVKELISVIIPHYNSVKTLRRAVRSVLAQSYPVSEIIIVDDASTGENQRQLSRILELSPKISLLIQGNNMGPASARNAGWEVAQGDWIAFLDSDDAWHPRKLEFQMRAVKMSPEPVDLVGSATEVIKSDQISSVDFDYSDLSVVKISTWDLLRRNRFSTPTVVLRSTLPMRFTEGRRYSEDYELWIRIVGDGRLAVRVELPLTYLFKEHYGESGLSSNLIGMSGGELVTFRLLYFSGILTLSQFWGAALISIVKSVRRIVIASFRKLVK